jgi:hypothetical protein
MATRHTFIAPGQHFARLDPQTWRTNDRLTVLQVSPDALGLTWVTYRDEDGEDLVGPAAWFEAALVAGELVPVTATGRIPRC